MNYLQIARTLTGLVAIFLIFYAYVPYIISTVRKQTVPHAYSWFIWGLVTAIAFGAQVTNNGGFGSYVSLFAAIACTTIFVFALMSGKQDITRLDTASLVLGVLAIGLWVVTKTPLYSVILAAVIDLIGFIPTVRKAWLKPGEELYRSWVITFVRYVLSVLALSSYTVITVLYPVTMVVAIGLFCGYLLWRKSVIAK